MQAVNPDEKLKEGQQVVLTCSVLVAGVARSDIIWYKDGIEVTAGIPKSRFVKNSLCLVSLISFCPPHPSEQVMEIKSGNI